MVTLLIATRNAHKVGEIRAMLEEEFRYLTLSDFPNPPEVIEDAGTFAGNATRKAVVLAKWLSEAQSRESNAAGIPGGPQDRLHEGAPHPGPLPIRWGEGDLLYVLADDSGLEVEALDGAPGVHSARFAAQDPGTEGNSSSADNNAKLLRLLKNVPPEKRTARFRCVLALTPVVYGSKEGASRVCYADEAELGTELFDGTCEGRIGFAPHGHGGFGYDPLFIPDGHTQTFAELGEAVKNHLSHRAKALAKLKDRLASRAGGKRNVQPRTGG